MLYLFQAVPPPIIRSSKLYIQHRVLLKHLLLPAAIVEELGVQTLPPHHPELKTVYTASGTSQAFIAACRYRGRGGSSNSSAHHPELKTVYTASGTSQTFIAACRYRGRVGSSNSSAHHPELKTVHTASGTCQTFTAACRYRGRVGTDKYPMRYRQFLSS
jgi:pterin-4a-carbinolamine dehydratase